MENRNTIFYPKLFTTLRGYTWRAFTSDLTAGVIVGIVALPLAIAFVIIIFGIVEKYGLDGLIISTFMAGVMLVLMGVLRLGAIIKFIPYPLTVGFTAGIAVVIFSTQVRDFLGLPIADLPGEFGEKWQVLFRMLPSLDWKTTALTLDATGIQALLDMQRWCRKAGAQLVLEGVHAQPLIAIERAGLLERFGPDNLTPSIDVALARARQILEKSGNP